MRLFQRIRSHGRGDGKSDDKNDRIKAVVEYLQRNRTRLSTIPGVIAKISTLAADHNAGAHEYAKVCEVDQSTCMRLLCLANSVYYGGSSGTAIRTVRDAIVRIGFEKARDVIQSAAVSALFKSRDRIGSYSAGELWMNSVAVAVGARQVCLENSNVLTGVDPYLAGLLHNIGIPILHLCFLEDGFRTAVERYAEDGTNLCAEETACMGVNHMDVGVEVATRWKLPEDLVTVMGHHHEAEYSGEGADLVNVNRAAELIAFDIGIGFSDFHSNDLDAYEDSAAKVIMNQQSFDRIRDAVSEEISQLSDLGWFSGLSLNARSR